MSIETPKKAKTGKGLRQKPSQRRGTARRQTDSAVDGAAKTIAPGRYHHGALHHALLEAAERVLERDGLAGLTLRATAREAGVSHAAPKHHFGDLTGLLSELAALGFQKFGNEVGSARERAETSESKFDSSGEAYVRFALRHPAMFQLMFRGERLDMSRPALRLALTLSFQNFAGAIGELRHEPVDFEHLSLPQAVDMVRAWSLVHGFALLLQDHRLDNVMSRLPHGTTAIDLLRAILTPRTPTPQ